MNKYIYNILILLNKTLNLLDKYTISEKINYSIFTFELIRDELLSKQKELEIKLINYMKTILIYLM